MTQSVSPSVDWQEALDSAILSLRGGELTVWELELVRRRVYAALVRGQAEKERQFEDRVRAGFHPATRKEY